MHIVIIGAGIMGLSAAWALRKRGHRITLLEQGPIPNPAGSSVDRHRVIRYPYGAMAGYAALVGPAYAAWDRVWADLGERYLVETGCLCLCCVPGDWTDQSADTMDRLGHAYQRSRPEEVERRYPHLDLTGVRSVVETRHGGALLAERIVSGLADWLRADGAAVFEGSPVAEVDPARAFARLHDGREIAGDALVVAAGPWVARLLPDLAQRITLSRQVVIYVEPPDDLRAAWVHTPIVVDLAADVGIYTLPPIDGGGMKIGDHTFSLTGDPDRDRDAGAAECARLFEFARARFRHLDRCRLAMGQTCFYTVTRDEAFIIEQQDRAWIMTGFSGHGFKFGALMGEAVADGLEGRRSAADLAAWAAGRG